MRGDQPLREAGVGLLADRLEKAEKRLRPARKGDPNGVHDLRVAIRKIRAAISVLEETVLERGKLREQEKRLTRLFHALGDVRDHDVIVARVTATAEKQGLGAKGLRALVHELDTRGDEARSALRRIQRRDDPSELLAQIGRDAARALAKVRPDRDDHRLLVRHFAASVLVRRFETVLAYELVVPSTIEVLHRLRIAIKKMRYAIDFFADVLGKHAEDLDAPLQAVQDLLGNLHDHHVERALVGKVVRKHGSRRELTELRDADDAEAERLLADFGRSWSTISKGVVPEVVTRAVGDLLGRSAAKPRTLALRRAEATH